jgi:hypothetical protein
MFLREFASTFSRQLGRNGYTDIQILADVGVGFWYGRDEC